MPINYNKLLAANNNESLNLGSAGSNFNLEGIEYAKNIYQKNVYHIDDGLKNKSIRVTNPTLVMFNAIVNKDFGKDRRLELGMIALDIVEKKLPFQKYTYQNNGITLQVKKIVGRYGRFQTGFTITDAYSKRGTDVFNSSISVLEFFVQLEYAREIVNASVSLFSNGKIKISGGYLNQRSGNMNNEEYFEAQPELIREYIVDNYTRKEKFLRNDIVFNNVVSSVRFNKGFNLNLISSVGAKAYNIKYEPELSPNLFVKFGTYNFTMSSRGLVKIQNITEYDDIQESYELLLDFVNDMVEYEKAQVPNRQGRIPRMLKDRNVSENRLKKQKNFNPNAPAPEITRRGTSCPIGRRPFPYSMQGKCTKEGCYVKPNPQGQPCCYKIPKNTRYSELKVKAVFNRANVKVPNNVRKFFKFGNNTNTKRNNTSHKNLNNVKIKMNSEVGLKIGSRQCMRYSKVALVDILHRLGSPVTKTMTKEQLCAKIQSLATNTTNTNNKKGSKAVKFTNNGKVYVLTGNTVANLKIGGRVAKTIKRDKLFAFAQKLGTFPPASATIADVCRLIFEKMVKLRPKSPSPTQSPSPNVANMALKLRFRKNLIEEDIRTFLGPRWIEALKITNKDITNKAQELYKQLGNAISKNEVNIVPASVKEYKKKVLREWKNGLNVAMRRAKYSNKLVANFATTKKNNGKFPTHKEVLAFMRPKSEVL
jgi:TATA-box binding protein (TBP) (component of TFIID and TFIIIB)